MKTRVHMVGIGGIGMSALAQLYRVRGVEVCGSDREASPVTELLHARGIEVLLGHDSAHVSKDTDLLVYSDAVPKDNPERMHAWKHGIPERSYFEALGEATRDGTSIVVAGTHGKTTTTAMLAKVLIDAGLHPTVVAGSILKEQGSNFVEGRPDLFVIEGCEYRRHFLYLHPSILVVTNIELDHTDYYADLSDMQRAFNELAARVSPEGTIIANTDAPNVAPVLQDAAARIVPYQQVSVPSLLVPGTFNCENAQAAKAAVYALEPELHEADIDKALATFTGTWRRFEYKGTTGRGALVYDDYAHHPTAIEGTVRTVREAFPDKRLIVLFHPHLYSRTKSFFEQFARALAAADEALVLPIYAAREPRDGRVTSEALVQRILELGGIARFVPDFEGAEKRLGTMGRNTLILTMGAGDVYHVADALTKGRRAC